MSLPLLLYPALLCLLTSAGIVIGMVMWIKRRERPDPHPHALPAGIPLKAGLRQAEAELVLKLNAMMTAGRNHRF